MAIRYIRDHLRWISNLTNYLFLALVIPSQLKLLMERGTFNEGAKVKTKVNKGLFLWRKIVQNKARNDKFRFKNFSYEVYNKLELDLKNINFQKAFKI